MEEQIADQSGADGGQPPAENGLFCIPYACNLLLGLLCLLAAVRLVLLGVATLFESVPAIPPHHRPVFSVDINTATEAELQALPEIGHSLAKRIVEHRAALGGFQAVEELQDVQGFGPKRLENLRPLISVPAVADQTGSSLRAYPERDLTLSGLTK